MFCYDDLCRHPTTFPSLTGLNRAEFDDLVPRFERAERELRARSAATRREGKPRVNAPGAGPRHAHDARNRLLMALVGCASTRPTRTSAPSSACTSATPS